MAESWQAKLFFLFFLMNSFQIKVHSVHAEKPVPLNVKFVCARDEKADQTHELATKLLEAQTQDCQEPRSAESFC